METGFHKPRFRLLYVMGTIAVVALALASLPAPYSWYLAGWVFSLTLLRSVTDRLSPAEWAVLAVIGFILIGLLIPPVQASCTTRKRAHALSVAPTAPATPTQ